jgi:succinoglycan biosynthesis protein ExoA
MMKQRILHLRASNFVGGPEKQLLQYASCDLGKDFDVSIASFCDDFEGTDLIKEAAARSIDTLPLPADSFLGSVRILSSEIGRSNVRLLCAHGYKAAVLCAIASRLAGIPYVCFLRGWTRENRKVAFYEVLERMCAHHADRVICLSETQAVELRRQLEASRVRVVVNARKIRHYTLAQRRALKTDICILASFDCARPLVVTASRLSPEKGTASLIEAARILRSLRPDIQFAVFGEGAERERLERRSRSVGLTRAIRFLGYQRNFADVLAGADLLVNPSLTEQMPNVVLEAMSTGVPVVATAVGGVPELAQGGAITLVKPGDTNALAQTIANLIGNRSQCRSMIEKARERLADDFSPEKQAQQLKSLYSEFILSNGNSVDTSAVRISVVIPTRNEERCVAGLLDALRNQDYPPEMFEIVVADGMSTDRTSEIVAECASQSGALIRLIENPRTLSSAGRNVGIAAATGEIILFIDGHCHIPNRHLLKDVVRLFAQTGAHVLCRPQPLQVPSNNLLQNAIAAARASWLGHGWDSTIYSTNFRGWVNPSSSGAIYKRGVFEQFGVFDEKFDACEDVEFNYRLHKNSTKAYSSPELTIFYEPRKTLGALFRQMARYARGRVRLARKHPSSFSFFQLAPAALVLVAAAGPLAVFTPFLSVWLLIMAFYGGVVAIESIFIANRLGTASLPLTYVCFLAIHAGLGTGLILEWVAGKRRMTARVPQPVSAHKTRTRKFKTSQDESAAQNVGGA